METMLKLAVIILVLSNLLFTISLALYAMLFHFKQGQYLVPITAFMTIVFIILLLINLIKISGIING
jgi:hypothetical protein